MIVVCSVENFLNVKNNRHNIPKKVIYDYDKMTEESWTKYMTKVDALANSCELRHLKFNMRMNQTQLNYYWDLLQACIIKAADNVIPSHKSTGQHKIKKPPILSKLYNNLRFLYKFTKKVKSTCRSDVLPTDWIILYAQFHIITQEFGLNIVALPPSPPTYLLHSLLPCLKMILNCLLVKTKLHEHDFKLKSIQQAIEARLENYAMNPSRMIDSVLNRSRRTIILDRCLDNSTTSSILLTNEAQVKNKVNQHFQLAAGTSHEDMDIPDDWIPFYQPVESISGSIYNDLMAPPTADEWYNIIASLPNGKAPGPSKVSNEMLKHLGSHTKKLFWYIICHCLAVSTLPHR